MLLTGKCEKLGGQLRPALGGLQCAGEPPADLLVLHSPDGEVEVADYSGQKVVEVVSDAASHLAHRLHLLCLLESSFGLLSLRHLRPEPFVALQQLPGAVVHKLFEMLSSLLSGGQMAAYLVLTPARAQTSFDRADHRHRRERTIQQ